VRSATVMAEYREGALSEAQLFYAPTHYLSFGVGRTQLTNDFMPASHSVTYARLNLLVHRWNMDGERYCTYVKRNVRFFVLDTDEEDLWPTA